ncbi:HYC_CC_PP family protein [Kordia sp.]|uniref:HYC_CC_PP family protein n=1 Tax=Kordia sp. TaxID=1965332 RepID=UPI003D2D726E
MQKTIKHTSSFVLALLVLCSTFSFTINEHICGGQKMSMAIGIPAENCGMEMEQSPSNITTIQQTPCCNDISTFIQGQNELQSNYNDISFTTQTFIKAFVYSYIYILPAEDQEKAVYKPYIPPPLIKDIQLLSETFLI